MCLQIIWNRKNKLNHFFSPTNFLHFHNALPTALNWNIHLEGHIFMIKKLENLPGIEEMRIGEQMHVDSSPTRYNWKEFVKILSESAKPRKIREIPEESRKRHEREVNRAEITRQIQATSFESCRIIKYLLRRLLMHGDNSIACLFHA